MTKFLLDKVENILGKGGNAWLPAFLFFPCVKILHPPGRKKSGMCGKWLNHYQTTKLVQIADNILKCILNE